MGSSWLASISVNSIVALLMTPGHVEICFFVRGVRMLMMDETLEMDGEVRKQEKRERSERS